MLVIWWYNRWDMFNLPRSHGNSTGCWKTFTPTIYNLKPRWYHKVSYTRLKPVKNCIWLVIGVINAYKYIKTFCIIHQNTFAFENFGHKNLVFMQNKPDIRNQHNKLHLIVNFLSRKLFLQRSICSTYRLKSSKKWRRSMGRPNFAVNFFA